MKLTRTQGRFILFATIGAIGLFIHHLHWKYAMPRQITTPARWERECSDAVRLMKDERFDEAHAKLEAMLRQYPSQYGEVSLPHVTALHNMGALHLDRREYRQAVVILEDAWRLLDQLPKHEQDQREPIRKRLVTANIGLGKLIDAIDWAKRGRDNPSTTTAPVSH